MTLKSNYLYIIIPSILLCLIPLALLTGPFLPDLFLVLIAISYLIKSFEEKFSYFFESNFIILLTIFTIYILIRSLISINPMLSLESSLFYFRYIFFSLSVCFIFFHNKNLISLFLKINISLVILVILDSWLQFFTGSNIIGYEKIFVDPGYRVSSFFNDKFILGSYLQKMILILIPLIFYKNEKLSKIKFMMINFFYIFIVLTVLITGERASFLLVFFSYFLFLIFIEKFKVLKILIFSSFFILISIFIFNSNSIKPRLLNYTIDQFTNFSSSDTNFKYSKIIDSKIIIFSPFHTGHYKTSLNMFKSNYIFGHGTKLYRELCSKSEFRVIVIEKGEFNEEADACSTHSHNIYLQLLSETGLIGFLFVFSFFIYLFLNILKELYFRIFKKRRLYSNFKIMSFLSLFVLLWPVSPHQNFFNNWVCVLYFISFGIFLLSMKKKKF